MEDKIFFNQSKYIEEMLKKFELEDSKPTKMPMSTEIKLTKDDEADSVDSTKYRGMIVFSTWMAFGGNTRDLGSFGKETDEITDLHQILEEILLTGRGDGVASIKRRRRDPSSDDVRYLVTVLQRGRLNEYLVSST
ncbi:hypothetical protein Tco_1195780 [Tanacetum coccineum]